MAIEKERKFLLEVGFYPKDLIFHVREIEQFYLFIGKNDQLRIRVLDNKWAYIAYKYGQSSLERQEFEYEIPLEDARAMMALTKISLNKTRHTAKMGNNIIDIDIYPDGLKIVEIEYKDELNSIPDFCGKEVTGVDEYSNINIALKNAGNA